MNTVQSVTDAIRQVGTASVQGADLFAASLGAPGAPGERDWVQLEPAAATKVYIDLEAALDAVRSIARQIPGGVSIDLGQYLDRAANGLEYSLATISPDAGDQVKAHASRARSARRQLAGLADLSQQALDRIGRNVLTDIAAAEGGQCARQSPCEDRS